MPDKKNIISTISDAEWDVMRVVCTLKSAHASEIINELKTQHDWSDSTIKTLIRRLVQKKLLNVNKDGRKFIYSSSVTQKEMIFEAGQDLFNKICDMHKGELLLYLLKSAPISKADLKKIQLEAIKKESTAPTSVECNCLVNNQKMC